MTQSRILNIAGYKFLSLNGLDGLRDELLSQTASFNLLGTILLSHEGININLAGQEAAAQAFAQALAQDTRFADIQFHRTYSDQVPFKALKVKVKDEIITFNQPDSIPNEATRAASVTPETLKQWLDEHKDLTLLDTRNDYEYRFGTFEGAVNLHIDHFGELPAAINTLNRDKPLVMFCTGGIRCEKAGLYMQQQGFKEVYQLDSGILGYFAKAGGAHYQGECFVFDKRISVKSDLEVSDTTQCTTCEGPIFAGATCQFCPH